MTFVILRTDSYGEEGKGGDRGKTNLYKFGVHIRLFINYNVYKNICYSSDFTIAEHNS